jgi:hypothetical protein
MRATVQNSNRLDQQSHNGGPLDGTDYARRDETARLKGVRVTADIKYEMQSVDEWIALQGAKMDRSEAIRRLVELGLKAKEK